MGALVETLNAACEEELESITQSVFGEMKGIVGAHSRTGQALAAVHVESTGAMSRFVGGTHLHLYYLNEGNGGPGATITSTRAYDRQGRPPGKLAVMDGMYTGFRNSVSGYAGIHFVEEIASHY